MAFRQMLFSAAKQRNPTPPPTPFDREAETVPSDARNLDEIDALQQFQDRLVEQVAGVERLI